MTTTSKSSTRKARASKITAGMSIIVNGEAVPVAARRTVDSFIHGATPITRIVLTHPADSGYVQTVLGYGDLVEVAR